jgi:hypothetical protein
MQRTTLWISAILLVLVIVGVFIYLGNSNTVSDMAAESSVRNTVTQFGASLKMVSLLASTTEVSSAMDQNYAEYVTPELLNAWKNDPQDAPGRLTSSPYPDSIDIGMVKKNDDGSYTVTGSVVESSNAMGTSTSEGRYPITAVVEKVGDSWLISDFTGYNVQ